MCRNKINFLPKEIVRFDKLENYTTFRIGGKATILFPRTIKEFVFVLSELEKRQISYKVIGNGSNLLADSRRHKTIYVVTTLLHDDFVLDKNRLCVPAGANINQVILFCQNKGLGGLEKLFGIPATVGGMIVMNAGAFKTQIFDHLESIFVYKNGKVFELDAKNVSRGDHKSDLLNSDNIILSATFCLDYCEKQEIMKTIRQISLSRQNSQPKGNSAGCVFKNPEGDSAGRIIDSLGLKGLKVKNATISDVHANFIISDGANSLQVLKLIEKIQNIVYEKTGIWLVPEIEYIGENNDTYRRLSHTFKIQ